MTQIFIDYIFKKPCYPTMSQCISLYLVATVTYFKYLTLFPCYNNNANTVTIFSNVSYNYSNILHFDLAVFFEYHFFIVSNPENATLAFMCYHKGLLNRLGPNYFCYLECQFPNGQYHEHVINPYYSVLLHQWT